MEELWSEPIAFRDDLPSVQAFRLEFLPVSLRNLVEDTAERMQTPLDFPAIVATVSLAGSVNRRITIQPKRQDHSWQVIPNLWGGICAPPGFMKSPVLKSITSPLARVEALWRQEFASETDKYKTAAEEAQLMIRHWESNYREALKEGSSVPPRPDITVDAPVQRRLLVNDASTEKLHEILCENPAGVFVIRDELVGWIAEMEKPDRGNQRAFYLQAWNGDSGFTMDRIGRGTLHAEAVCVSLFGNVQPSRLRAYLVDAFAGGPMDDGLFQRLQLLVWPDSPCDWELVDRAPNRSAEDMASKVFAEAVKLSSEYPVRMRFSDDAQELFFLWLTDLERKVRKPDGHSAFIVSHLAKYRSLVPSLAGLFELADRLVLNQVDELTPLTIDPEHTQQAILYCSYLESHANRVYSCVAARHIVLAQELGEHILRGELGRSFSTRTVYRKGWAGLSERKAAEEALEQLASQHWLRKVNVDASSPLGGRSPSDSWQVNPLLQIRTS